MYLFFIICDECFFGKGFSRCDYHTGAFPHLICVCVSQMQIEEKKPSVDVLFVIPVRFCNPFLPIFNHVYLRNY